MNISKSFTHKMAAKISWHRYGTKLRHCRPMYKIFCTVCEQHAWSDMQRHCDKFVAISWKKVPKQKSIASRCENASVRHLSINRSIFQSVFQHWMTATQKQKHCACTMLKGHPGGRTHSNRCPVINLNKKRRNSEWRPRKAEPPTVSNTARRVCRNRRRVVCITLHDHHGKVFDVSRSAVGARATCEQH